MVLYQLNITKEEKDLILKGLSDDGAISEEAEKAMLSYIEEGKSKEYPIWEVKRQFRTDLGAEEGLKIAKAIDKLW